jgi:hypothetical protein
MGNVEKSQTSLRLFSVSITMYPFVVVISYLSYLFAGLAQAV